MSLNMQYPTLNSENPIDKSFYFNKSLQADDIWSSNVTILTEIPTDIMYFNIIVLSLFTELILSFMLSFHCPFKLVYMVILHASQTQLTYYIPLYISL